MASNFGLLHNCKVLFNKQSKTPGYMMNQPDNKKGIEVIQRKACFQQCNLMHKKISTCYFQVLRNIPAKYKGNLRWSSNTLH